MNHRGDTFRVLVGGLPVGGGAPVRVQSMTNTDTADVAATTTQCRELAEAGSELVRITVNTEAAARAVPEIAKRLADQGCPVPLIGDFHFNGHKLLAEVPDCARALAKYRINPGNVGAGKRRDDNFTTICRIAVANGKPVRIGVNGGSLNSELVELRMAENTQQNLGLDSHQVLNRCMVESALTSTQLAIEAGLRTTDVILSCKVSRLPDLVEVYRSLAAQTRQPLHLGLTEAGMGDKGVVASAGALAILLAEGIGDTIRVSLTPEPGGDRRREVRVAQEILQSLRLRAFAPEVTACPGCGRTTSSTFQVLARDIEDWLRERRSQWVHTYPGSESLTVAVMGCIVNGPGESKEANIGISLPGTGEAPKCPVFVDGKLHTTLQGTPLELAAGFRSLVENYVSRRYGVIAEA